MNKEPEKDPKKLKEIYSEEAHDKQWAEERRKLVKEEYQEGTRATPRSYKPKTRKTR